MYLLGSCKICCGFFNHPAHPEHFLVTNKTTVKIVKSLLLQPAVGEEPWGCWLGHIGVSSSSSSSVRRAWLFLLLPRSSEERTTLHFSISLCCKNVWNPRGSQIPKQAVSSLKPGLSENSCSWTTCLKKPCWHNEGVKAHPKKTNVQHLNTKVLSTDTQISTKMTAS